MTVKQLLIAVLVTLVLPMLPQELYAWCPTVAGWLLRLAARLVPPHHRARYQQEWLAQLDAWEGRNLAAFLYALSILLQTPRMRLALRGSVLAQPQRRRAPVAPGQVAYRCAALLAALTTLLVAVWLTLDLGGPDVASLVGHSAQAMGAVCAGVACFYASRWEVYGLGRAWTQALRRGWRLAGAGAIVWGLATLLWMYQEWVLHTQPSIPLAQIGYLASVPLLVTGMLAFPISVGQPAARIRTLLDALIIAASLLAVSWVTTISPLIDQLDKTPPGELSSLDLVVQLASPIFDILVATVALSLLVRTRGRDPAPMTTLCLAMLALAVASSGYVHLEVTGRYGAYNLIDVLRLVGWLLILVAAVRPMAAHVDRREERQSLARITLPYALLALVTLTVVTVRVSTDELSRFLLIDSIVLAALVIARQLVTLIENRQLNRRLENMVEELSEREAQLEWALQREQQATEHLRLRVHELEGRMD